MMGLGMPELIVILVLALIIFGAGKLPEIGTSLGRSIQNFKKASERLSEPEPEPEPEPPKPLPPEEMKKESSSEDQSQSTKP